MKLKPDSRKFAIVVVVVASFSVLNFSIN